MKEFEVGETVVIVDPTCVDYGKSFTITSSRDQGASGFFCGQPVGAPQECLALYGTEQANKAMKERI